MSDSVASSDLHTYIHDTLLVFPPKNACGDFHDFYL